ncbi:uncharacterized protein LOC131649340 [Vicia villosa]|uniref:uncharacterized protein LOC131649340 n=1 Tax=Vicia villosa TaxID=3911 RepID=UPI00273C62FF|nr:uncharacterized protein LOC131649340 [Vicia villosa]
MLDVWEMDTESCIIVNLDKYGQPIGPEGTTVTRFIGSLVRRKQYASIKYKSWKVMPDKEKDEMLAQIETIFEFVPPMNDIAKQMLKLEMNIKWKQWKCDLKSKAFDPSKTEEEVASFIPDCRVDPDQYRELVHHWFSEEAQNRAKYEDIHCMGTKSLPRLINEKAKGASPTRKEIYIDTRTRKDGSVVNEKAARLIEELNKHNNEAETSQSIEKTPSHLPWTDDIYSQVKGPEKRGRVKCLGNIPKPKKSKASLSENQELRDELKKMRES